MTAPECTPLPVYRNKEQPTVSEDCSKDQAARKLYDDSSEATAQISNSWMTGSGFFVEDGSRVITNAHVARGNYEPLTVKAKDGTTYKARIERYDDINDLAVLKLEKGAHSPHVLEITSSLELTGTDQLYGMGHPGGRSETYISPGFYQDRYPLKHTGDLIKEKSGLEESFTKASNAYGEKSKADGEAYGNSERLQVLMAGEPGSSGSAIVNGTSKVVGVIANGPPGKTMAGNLWAVPSDAVQKLLHDDPKFDFKYEDHSLIRHHPIFVGSVGVIGGGLLAAFPRTAGSLVSIPAALSLKSDWNRARHGETAAERTTGYLGLTADVGFIAGAALSFSRVTKPYGYAGLAIGLASTLGQSFVPDQPYLVEITRRDGDKRPPFWWDKD